MEKPSLPIKTKIAAWWMIGTGVVELIWGCFMAILSIAAEVYERYKTARSMLLTGIFIGGLLIIFSLFLLKRKRRSWGLAVALLFILLIATIFINPIRAKIFDAELYGVSPPQPWSIFLRLPILPNVVGVLIMFFGFRIGALFHFILFLIPLILLLESLSTKEIILSIKTKVAAWWMMLIGILIMILGMVMIIDIRFLTETVDVLISFLIFLTGGFICFLSFWIREGKRWAWGISIFVLFILSLSLLWLLFGGPSPLTIREIFIDLPFLIIPIIILLIPIILFLLDRKNFWKVAT